MAVDQPVDRVKFIRSSYCSLGGCVEVGRLADGSVAIRDGKDPDGHALIFTDSEWSAFLAGVHAGEFDSPGVIRTEE